MIPYLRAFWRNLTRRRTLDQDLDDEIRSYVEMSAQENLRSGMPSDQAHREARLAIGGVEQVKQAVRDRSTGVFLDTLLQDLGYALRTLKRNFGFSSVVILSLAPGIGANTAIFTVVNGVLIKPLPYPEPDRLLMLWETSLSDGTLGTVAPANFYDWREQSDTFEKMAAIDPYPDFILNGSGRARRFEGAAVSRDFFSLLGTRMALGPRLPS